MSDEALQVFPQFGIELKEVGSQLLGDCPFCGKSKFYVHPEKTIYHCKVCDEKGNAASLAGSLFDKVYRKALTPAIVKKHALNRKLPVEAFLFDPNLGYDANEGKLVFKSTSFDGSFVALRTAHEMKGGYRVMNQAGCQLALIGCQIAPKKGEPLYICEGEWDRIALMWMLKTLKRPGVVWAVPGAGTWKAEWSVAIAHQDIIALYDHDDAGRKGAVRFDRMTKTQTKTKRFIHWDEDKEDGYDIRDLIVESIGEPGIAFDYIAVHLEKRTPGATQNQDEEKHEVQEHEQEKMEPISVQELHEVFQKWLCLENCDLLDITMGTMWSTYLPGNPLWLMVVSPPSASKSETLIPVSAYHRCYPLSTVTTKSLISGYQLQGNVDPSLFAAMENERAAIIVKDLTPLLQGNEAERDEVFGILRDAYDGSASKIFGNGVKREYQNLHFSIIAGVTPAIDAFDSVAMGERFLKFRADREIDRDDDVARAYKAITNCGDEKEMREDLRQACVRSLVRKIDPEDTPKPDEKFARIISELATVCARLRAVAPSDRFSDIQQMSPIMEAPPRLATQFTKLAQGLSIHFGTKNLLDPRILRLIRRVVIHTPDILTVRVVRGLYDLYDDENCNVNTLLGRVRGLSRDTIQSILTKLARTGTVEYGKTMVKTGTIKPASSFYRLGESVYDIIKRNDLFGKLPKNDPLYLKPRFTLKKKEVAL